MLSTAVTTYFFTESLQAADEPWPEVSKEGPVNLLQAVLGAGVHTHVQLSDWNKVPAMTEDKDYYILNQIGQSCAFFNKHTEWFAQYISDICSDTPILGRTVSFC